MPDLPCVFCKQPESAHGPPGESDMARHLNKPTYRLCPVPGVTSQFYASIDQLVGKKWQGSVTLRTCDEDGEPDGETISLHVEQAKERKPAADLLVVKGSLIVRLVSLDPYQLDVLATFLHEAADMIRHCSES